MTNKVLQIESGVLVEGATPSVTLKDTDTTDLQHTLSSSTGLVFSADVNNVEASSTIDFAVDGSTVGTLGPTGNLTLTSESSPIVSLTDTTNTVTASVYAQNSNVFYGSTTNHPTNIGSNNTTAITIDTAQNTTVTGTLDVQGSTLSLGVADTTGGILTIHGNGTGNAEGGEIRLATAADHDTTYEFYRIDVVGDDFRIGRQGLTDISILQSGNVGINNSDPTTAKLVVDGDDNTYTIRAEGGATAGQSYGIRIRAGSNASDTALLVENKAADTTFMEILGDGSVNINGNLTVTGTTTSISNTNTTIADALIELGSGNAGANSNDLGLILERGTTGDNGFIGFDESADQFVVATTTATGASTGDLTLTDANFRASQITTSYANNASGVMRNIYQSTSAPTGGDGQIGDLWILYA